MFPTLNSISSPATTGAHKKRALHSPKIAQNSGRNSANMIFSDSVQACSFTGSRLVRGEGVQIRLSHASECKVDPNL